MLGRSAVAVVTSVVALALGCAGSAPRDLTRDEREPIATAQSAVVGGVPSTTEDDFVVFLSHVGVPSFACAGTLVAPNLVLTAKHCVYEYVTGASVCDASGEPQPGSVGGAVTKPIPLNEIGIHAGADGKKRFIDGESPASLAKVVIDDKTATLCSHDLAYVVLEKPIAGMPTARMRLGKRPEQGGMIAVAGWGRVEDRIAPQVRVRRTGIAIQRVGEPVAKPDATGSLGPRTFESGPGACDGDSGSPGYDFETGTVLGVVARALKMDPTHPVSPCLPDDVTIVYTVPADFPNELRAAFTAANAEPWLEGRPSAGYLRFGDACSSDLECEGARCKGAGGASGGTCDVDCTKAGRTCPSGYTCGATGGCEIPAATPAGTATPGTEGPDAEPEPEARTSSCTAAPGSIGDASPWLVIACAALGLRRRARHS